MATSQLLQNGLDGIWSPAAKPCQQPEEEALSFNSRADQDHDYVLELIHGFLKTQILFTGVSVGVFDALQDSVNGERVPLAALAQTIQLPQENAEKLLNALAALKLAVRESTAHGVFYRGTSRSSKYLTRSSPVSLVPILHLAAPMMLHMSCLGDSLKTAGWFQEMELVKDTGVHAIPEKYESRQTNNVRGNKPIDKTEQTAKPNEKVPQQGLTNPQNTKHGGSMTSNGIKTPSIANGAPGMPTNCFEAMAGKTEVLAGFQLAMNAYAVNACHLLDNLNLEKFSSAVDLGGGFGTIGRYLAAKHPRIQTTIYDIPAVVELGKKHESEMKQQLPNLNYKAGDFFGEDLPEADIYMLGHILHDWKEKDCRAILRKVHRALKPGGVLLILEKIVHPSRDGPLSALLLNLVLMMSTPGEERTLAQYTDQLEDSGFRLVTHRADSAFNWYDLMLAKKA